MREKQVNRLFLESALRRQLFYCCENPRYIAGVLISNSDKKKLIDLLINNVLTGAIQ